ncbi:ParB/RepB/Spo0J family partition protein [Streptomyces sp. NBC_01264]|uniref:ParB/RepB/Spo0J family partition protein n=1 Tax=Streptomyces sp. NBC_01264 TaxID=2903804 RepID=UPI002258902E|nr:ParB/RepB/Spo0J family partition protein [Streptomyces sp. NBC_01264]MCX4784491.1 ParB/RepB/Spo0J family partition protein [Streptomyces sp. NBC_01264]
MNTRQSAADRVGSSSSFGRAALARSTRGQLIAAATGEAQEENVTELSLDRISPNPDNPRDTLGDIEGLASSLAEIGLVQAITVATVEAYLNERPGREDELADGAQYVVIDGHRRLAAAHEAGIESIRITVNDALAATDEKLLEAAFVANAQRENLTDLEEANALSQLVKLYGSQHKAAKRLGVTQPYISQRLSLLALAPDLQADLEAGRRKVEHVRGLAKLTPEEQRTTADERARAPQLRRRTSVPTQQSAPATDNAVISTPSAADTVELPPNPEPTDNAVITSKAEDPSAASPSTDNAVISEEDPTARLADVRTLPPMPWHDGNAVMDLVIATLDEEQRTRFLHRYVERSGSKEALVADLARSLPKEGRLQLASILAAVAADLRTI